MNMDMEILLIPMSTPTYTLTTIRTNMLIRIYMRETRRIMLIPTKVNTDPMSTTTLTMTESRMNMFSKANSAVGKDFIGAQI